eukprot:scaffold113200_cov45-Phaeocystis_antarctica.AAC.2
MPPAIVCWAPMMDSPATVGTSDKYSGGMYRRTSWPARTSCEGSTSGGRIVVRRPRGGCEWRARVA